MTTDSLHERQIMTPDEVHSFVREYVRQTGEPVVTSREVSDNFECTVKTAKKRLEELVERGDLGRKKIGGRGNGAYYLRG